MSTTFEFELFLKERAGSLSIESQIRSLLAKYGIGLRAFHWEDISIDTVLCHVVTGSNSTIDASALSKTDPAMFSRTGPSSIA
jgi:hypothetical protein